MQLCVRVFQALGACVRRSSALFFGRYYVVRLVAALRTSVGPYGQVFPRCVSGSECFRYEEVVFVAAIGYSPPVSCLSCVGGRPLGNFLCVSGPTATYLFVVVGGPVQNVFPFLFRMG